MRNLLIAIVMLYAGAMSAQTFDFSPCVVEPCVEPNVRFVALDDRWDWFVMTWDEPVRDILINGESVTYEQGPYYYDHPHPNGQDFDFQQNLPGIRYTVAWQLILHVWNFPEFEEGDELTIVNGECSDTWELEFGYERPNSVARFYEAYPDIDWADPYTYYDQFMKDLAFYRPELNVPEQKSVKLTLVDHIDGAAATALGVSQNEIVDIILTESVWYGLTPGLRMRLMYHELGHDVLNRTHAYQYKNIMAQSNANGHYNYNGLGNMQAAIERLMLMNDGSGFFGSGEDFKRQKTTIIKD